MEIIAEDLGTVPDFVRESLARLEVPGYKVFRWERKWHDDGQPFRDPVEYPAVAVATSGTHDTEPMAIWWENAPREERQAVLAIPSLRARLSDDDRARALDGPELPHPLHEALLETLVRVGSEHPDPADPGRVRLARPHQPAGHGRQRQLDVAPALAGGSHLHGAAGDGRRQSAPGVVAAARTVSGLRTSPIDEVEWPSRKLGAG